MRKLVVFLMVLGLLIGGSSLAQALRWQTLPVLGTSTDQPAGDVLVYTDSGVVNIPHNIVADTDPNLVHPWSMTLFHVGDTVDAGSGIYYDKENNPYMWAVVYAGPSRTESYGGIYPGDSGEGFVMNYLDPLSTLMPEDVGTWLYTESWVDLSTGGDKGFEQPLVYSAEFRVAAVPEPATMLLLGLGLLGIAGIRRRMR